MGYFPYKEPSYGHRILNACSPEPTYGEMELRQVTESERPYYAAIEDELASPDETLKTLARELTDPITIQAGAHGQKFGALWLNRDVAAEAPGKVLVNANGFLANITSSDDRIRAFFLARAFADHQILMIDQPGHGISDLYTTEQRKAALGRGDMSAIGESQDWAIQDFLEAKVSSAPAYKLRANSFGSRQGLDVIRANQNNPSARPIAETQLLELPGTVQRRFGIHGAFCGYEYLRQKYYDAQWLPHFKQTFEDFIARYGTPVPTAPSFLARDKVAAVHNFWHSILGYDTGLGVLEEVTTNGAKIVRVSGGVSRIDNPVKAISQWEQLGSRYGQVIALHESHDAFGHLSRARAAGIVSRWLFEQSDLLIARKTPTEINVGRILPELSEPGNS